MNYFAIVLEQISIFVVYAIIGIVAVRKGILDRQALNLLSRLIARIILPLLIFTNAYNGATRAQFIESLPLLGLSVLLYLILYFVAGALAAVSGLQGDRRKIYRACVMFGNCGFMGIPLTMALFPERGGLYIAIYSIIDQLVLWTVGVGLTSPEARQGRQSRLQDMRRMINPATIAITLAVVLLLAEVRLPEFLNTAVHKAGLTATPLAMIYLGGMFCYIKVIDYMHKREILLEVVTKMVLLPLALFAALSRLTPVPTELAVTISLIGALPTMTAVSMIAESQGSDGDYAAGMIFATTLFSIVTIPLVCALL